MDRLEADLAAYYDQEANERAVREIDPERAARRDWFASLMHAEGRTSVLEVGTGPGRDAAVLLTQGLSVSGVDLSSANVARCREAGVDAYVASIHEMPFDDDAFDAGWTMSTLVHVPDAHFDDALRELRRVLVAGAPVAVGLWGGADAEGRKLDDTISPQRFFSFRSDSRARQMLARHGHVERFDTWPTDPPGQWTYQWCLLRV